VGRGIGQSRWGRLLAPRRTWYRPPGSSTFRVQRVHQRVQRVMTALMPRQVSRGKSPKRSLLAAPAAHGRAARPPRLTGHMTPSPPLTAARWTPNVGGIVPGLVRGPSVDDTSCARAHTAAQAARGGAVCTADLPQTGRAPVLGVRGSQVQILSARHTGSDTIHPGQTRFSCRAAGSCTTPRWRFSGPFRTTGRERGSASSMACVSGCRHRAGTAGPGGPRRAGGCAARRRGRPSM
jgi:hypothetical protein